MTQTKPTRGKFLSKAKYPHPSFVFREVALDKHKLHVSPGLHMSNDLHKQFSKHLARQFSIVVSDVF